MSVLRYFQTSLIRQHRAPQASSAPAPRWTPARYALVLLSGVLGAAIPGAWWMYQRHGRIALGLVALPLAAVATPPVTAPAPAVRAAQTPAALAAPALATVAPVPMPSSGTLAAGTYVMTPFVDNPNNSACWTPPQPGCSETPADDSIRVTLTVPAGWEPDPLHMGVWLSGKNAGPPGGAVLLVERGGWPYQDPCHESAATAP